AALYVSPASPDPAWSRCAPVYVAFKFLVLFFFKGTATAEIYPLAIGGDVKCVKETGIFL
ncbi:hypothetical protein, partial [Clostridioides difficile]|uniref:hypothetical protein n=1 Tax=Clostridioides difficile TaxID=1496 RepID=UPI001A9A4441